MWICPPFWLSPNTGPYSKAGILLHEVSHYFANGRTIDLVYHRDGAVKLGIDSPDDAIINADNYAFFAENIPYLD